MNTKLVTSIIIIVLFVVIIYSVNKNKQRGEMIDNSSEIRTVEVIPIEHATMVLKWGDKVIYTDPVGGEAFNGQPAPDLILLTDIHGDHLNADTLAAVSKTTTVIVAPEAVLAELPQTIPGTKVILRNGEKITEAGLSIEAIPMYNLPETPDSRHTKGRGNGYVVEGDGTRVYISGDTSDTPELRALKNIDIAFVSMNLPYTMSVESAASGVLAFKPKHVYPYHYRGQDGLSDINRFKTIVNAGDPHIDVVLLNWYPNN